jgi:peptidoglycan/xylan/chitin deacetylase (PgdA/CDA1 family)
MNRSLRGVAWAVAAVIVAYGTYRAILHVREPVIPAIVTRTMDSHRALSRSLDMRLDRFLHDRPAGDGAERRLVALTFDDGPYPVETPLLLDVLAELHVKATFFLIGHDTELFPELAERIERDGHEIANHTLTHPSDFESLDPRTVRSELEGGAEALERYVYDPAIRTMMRPPHGRFSEETVKVAQDAGYHVILWNDDPGDWRAIAPAKIAEHVEAHATAPDIILLHSGRLATVEMLPQVVARFRKAGFTFVTVGGLMQRLSTAVINHPEKRPV